jgi:RluA family pseudouridine synthase
MTESIERLFESPAILAVNKPAGVASIPDRGDDKDDLLTLLSKGREERLFVVHRLDKGVTGVILFAKTASAHRFLNDQFAARTIKKTYSALVQGVMKDDQARYQGAIRKFGSGRMGVDPQKGVEAVTEVRVIERFPAYTLIDAMPRTGRRHQIRVHLFAAGHPICGDRLYGDRRFQGAFESIRLHSREIDFEVAPGSRMKITAPVPADFLADVERVRNSPKPLSVLPDFVWEKINKRETERKNP